MVYGSAILALIVVVAALSWLLWSAKADLRDLEARDADYQRAEEVAVEYATGASEVDYQDSDAWLTRLKANTSSQLANKFDATAPKLQEILIPLKWTSTGVPIAAKVSSESGGIYYVNVFLNVTSSSAQTPNGAQTTVTYNVTVDSNSDWAVTDVGGMDGALPAN
ncbi:hypothetical protein [Hoyosella subflava]|uniref:Mce-associated membrane protein n=1 Tax=Hoyosella subflava (strain DSM 45089 / JCM 17490 / NBRC 109087 / DQS3-9A1) TaxID=443218 RepID=F6ERN7_HOYSD|nr:hypothetical protein [Hoyosella subflava]AEF39614.1 hypothetical protein AS9A_1162 [Hoyosella subflava DQS3-9A1]